MKRLLTITFAILFICSIFAAPAAARGWCFNCSEAGGTLEGAALATDYSFSDSDFLWWSGDDWAEAGGFGQVVGNVTTQANGLGIAMASEDVFSEMSAKACTLAVDLLILPVSFTTASMEIYGEVSTFGMAWGPLCGSDFVNSEVLITGDIFQNNFAQEGTPGGQFVNGGSSSTAVFTASNASGASSHLFGIIPAVDCNVISGGAVVEGSTFVTIDKYGSTRGFYGETQSSSQVNVVGASVYNGTVTGNGVVAGTVEKNGTYAGGISHYSYTGGHTGNGNATINATIYSGGDYSTSHISGSSFATGF